MNFAVQALGDAETPLTQRQIRERAAIRPATVGAALEKLIREHRVECAPGGGYPSRRCRPGPPGRVTEHRYRFQPLAEPVNDFETVTIAIY